MRLEPISKLPKQDNQTGELNKPEEVHAVVPAMIEHGGGKLIGHHLVEQNETLASSGAILIYLGAARIAELFGIAIR
jgi:hypothetical protein